MEKPTILVKELHLTSLREKYMSDPDIIPPSGTTKQEYVDQMVSQLERQNRNNSRAYSLLTPTASDTAEGGGSDMYVQINRIKKAAKMLQKSYDEEDYMQAIKLSMQRHSDEYSFLKAKEEDPPNYKIVHRYQTKGAGDSRSFIVIDSADLDAPITLTRKNGRAHSTSKSGSSQSWYPTYGYAQPYAYGNSAYNSVKLEHVQQLEDSILNDDESRRRHAASNISSTQDAFDTIFADWKDDPEVFPKTKGGRYIHDSGNGTKGLKAFIKEAQENQEGPKREAYNKWMDHVKSLARSAPRLDQKGSYGASDYGKTFVGKNSEWGLSPAIGQILRQSHHTWLSEGQPDSENMRHFNYPSFETMHIDNTRQIIKADSPEGLINKKFSEDSSVRASLLPLMRIIHHINENSDIENSSVWKADATGLEAGSELDEGDYEIHSVDSFSPENADNINAIHQNAINDRVAEGVITQEKADGALLNQPKFLERLKLSINPGGVVEGLSSILADKSAVHSTAQSFGSMLVNTIKGAPPTKGFDHPNVPSEAENSIDPPAELPPGLGNYLESGNAPISKDQFDSLSALRQHIFADRFQEMITTLHSGGNLTQENIDAGAEGLSDDLHKTKSDTYLSSDDLLSDKSPYKDNIAKVEEQFSINLTTPSDEAAVEDTTEEPVPAEDEDAVDTEEVTPKDTAPVAQVEEDDDKVSDDQTEDEELTDEEQDLQIESGGAFFDNFSDEEQQAVLEASKQLPDSQRANLIAFIEAGDFDQLDNFISDPTSTTAPEVEEDEPEVEQDAPEAEEDSERGLNELEQQALDNLNDITNNAANKLSPELQRDVAQAAVSIQRTTTRQLDAAQKKAEKDNTDLTANQKEGLQRGGDASITALANAIETGKESFINEAVQKFRGKRESYENATERTTDQGRTGGTDGGGDREPVVPETQGDARESGASEGAGEEVTDENVDGDTVGRSVSDEVDDSARRSPGEAQNQLDEANLGLQNAQDELREAADARRSWATRENPAEKAPEGATLEQRRAVSQRNADEVDRLDNNVKDAAARREAAMDRVDAAEDLVSDEVDENDPAIVEDDPEVDSGDDDGDDGDDNATEEPEPPSDWEKYRAKVDSKGQSNEEKLKAVHHHETKGDEHETYSYDDFLEDEEEDFNKPKYKKKMQGRYSEAHTAGEKNDQQEKSSSRGNIKSFWSKVRNNKELREVMQAHVDKHVERHNGRDVPDTKYRNLYQYAQHLHAMDADTRMGIMEDYYDEVDKNKKVKEEEEAKAAETAETEASKEKQEQDNLAWNVESKRVQQQMGDMPTLLGPDGKIADKWDNSAALHYFRNVHAIVFHNTRKNLSEAGVDTSDIKDLRGLLEKLNGGDKMSDDLSSKISGSLMAVNKILTPRQKRDLSLEMQTVEDYMGPEHRKQLALDNQASRKNEEDYQKRGQEVVASGSLHPIFAGTSEENYRDKDGKIIPLFSDPEDMEKKDAEHARLREESGLGPEEQAERAKRRASQGHPPSESPGEGYAYHPESGQWVDRERFDTMTSHFDDHLKPGESVSFSPSNTLHTEHVGRDDDGKRSVVLQAHEPLSVRSKGASDYVSVTKNKKGQLIWSPVKPPEQNQHGFISPDVTHHDTGNPELDERLNNAHAVGQIKGTFHAGDYEQGSSADHARHGMENNIVRHHNLAGKAAPKNALQIGNKINEVLSPQNFSNITGSILNFSRNHGGSLASKFKLPEEAQKGLDEFRSDPSIAQAEQKIGETAQKVGGAAKKVGGAVKGALPDIARLFYDPTAQPKLYAKWAAAAAKAGTSAILGTGIAPEDLPKGKIKRGLSRVANIVPSEVSEAVGAAKDAAGKTGKKAGEKASDVVRGGLYAGNEKLNQATVTAADKAGSIIDRTKAGASQVGQDIASAGIAGVGADQPPSAGLTPEARAGQEAKARAQFGPEQKAPSDESERDAAKRLTPPPGTRDADGNLMDRTARREAGTAAAKAARRQPEPEPEKPVGEGKPGVAERAAMGAAGAVDTATEKLRGIGSALQSRKDSMPSETDKVEVEQDAARFGSDASTGGKKMDRAARRRQAKDIQTQTGTSSKDVQLVHPEPDTPVGKLQGFIGSVHSGREHRVDTDTSVAARPITPTPVDTPVTPDATPDTPDQQGLSRSERRKQKFGSKQGVPTQTGGTPSSGVTPSAAPPQRPADTSFRT